MKNKKMNENKKLKFWRDVSAKYKYHFQPDIPSWGYGWACCRQEDNIIPFVKFEYYPDGNIEVKTTELWKDNLPEFPTNIPTRSRQMMIGKYKTENPTYTYEGERNPTPSDIERALRLAKGMLTWLPKEEI